MPQIRGICSVPGCGRPHKARGYCLPHYQRWTRGAPVDITIAHRDRNPPETCMEPGCDAPVKSKGLCGAHYARLLRHGHTRRPVRTKDRKICTVPGCTDTFYARGLCHIHYMRQRKHRDVYNTTSEAIAALELAQGGLCATCHRPPTRVNAISGKPQPLVVDHNHKTGKVRGLLCDPCNRGIGLLQDDPMVLVSALRYLAKHSPDPQAVIDAAITALKA